MIFFPSKSPTQALRTSAFDEPLGVTIFVGKNVIIYSFQSVKQTDLKSEAASHVRNVGVR